MLPGDGSLVDPSIPSPFLWKMRTADDLLTDYERGGDALNLPGDSLNAQTWTFGYDAPDVWVEDEAKVRTVLFSKPWITELAGTFDQNMNPFVAFVDSAGAHFWWYDTTQGKQVFSDLPANSTTPRCCLDDHRSTSSTTSDIILMYQRGLLLCYVQQRGRFATEHVVATDVTGALQSIGMNTANRLQFKIRPANY